MTATNEKKPDIFDRIMSWGFLKRFEPFYAAHKEVLMYLFFGGLTTLVSVVTFWLAARSCAGLPVKTVAGVELHLDIIAANVISWVCAVTFAYITNRTWVFEDKAHGGRAVAKECAAFFAGRVFTLVVETLLLELCVTLFMMNGVLAKILVSIVTVILNYIVSKLFVFKKAKE
ncbi:MAG: GtrA family protein [Ruminococcus sp.]|nr:GtrA family protein [Ruminococcus sp.]